MFLRYSFILVLGYIVASASKVEILFKPLHPCRTSQICIRNLHCNASGAIKWLYPNSSEITSTVTAAKTISVDDKTLKLRLNPPEESDGGLYTCHLSRDSTNKDSVLLTVIVDPFFIYGSSPLFENKTALRYHNTFLNCSVYPSSINVVWEFGPNRILLDTRITNKYAINSSGMTIYNVTSNDEGHYVCVIGNVNPLEAFISLIVTWPPQLLSQQIETIIANIGMQVTLNCSVSSSPGPVYNWSIPGSCSSCPQQHHSNIMMFTADITDSGKYVCVAKNEYGNISKEVIIHVNSKPIMKAERVLITMGKPHTQRENIMLTCGIQYAYPTPEIEWNIKTPSSFLLDMQQNSSTNTNYFMHSNRSFEIYHRFLFEVEHVIALCTATNIHGSNKTVFHLWEHKSFTKEQQFTLYIKNITNCYQLAKDRDGLFAELVKSLRLWFNSSCHCDGLNNLYSPQLICLDNHTGNITSTVYHNGMLAAQEIINLTSTGIQMRDPPVFYLPYGWILCLSIDFITASPSPARFDNDNDNTSIGMAMAITIGIAGFCAILALIMCIIIGLVYMKCKRQAQKATTDTINTGNDKGKAADDKTKQESNPHIYEEIKQISGSSSKISEEKSEKLKDEVVFDVTGTHVQPPAYRTFTLSSCDSSNSACRRSNDYYIEDEDMDLSKENIAEKCQQDNNLKTWQSTQIYNKLNYVQ